MSRLLSRIFLLALAISLVGCASWEDLPAGATGFLVVRHESMEGTVHASGYCTATGWHLELRARAGARDVMNVLEVQSLLVAGRDGIVTFEPVVDQPTELQVMDNAESGRMSLESCAGDLATPEFVSYASSVSLKLAPTASGDVAVEYLAGFETGDSVHGQFEMEMPVVD